ncbi:mu-like prophage FluMu protein gp29 [Ylistrum balloti]|uniref:mu-like prophage FluMu protein gp29 n=1 Tax=Ylistrum balloti TaxID=509963 RepID=UPI002905D108|nr:mu-like prophage FluMu protein gp29 [Ylistrum balloti]
MRITKPVFEEVTATHDSHDSTPALLGQLMSYQDEIIKQRGGGNLKIYTEILRDDQVNSCFQQRRSAVVSWRVVCEPGGDRKQDKAACDFIEDVLNNLNFDDHTSKMLYGEHYGYSVAECLWGRDGRFITLEDIRVRDRSQFRFRNDGNLVRLTRKHPSGELMPDYKFWVFSFGADHDSNPYGLGLAHYAYWPVFFKRQDIKFWSIFLEKFGKPTTLGKYNRGQDGTKDKQKLLEALKAIGTSSAVIIPDSVQVELLEATRGGKGGYEQIYDRMDAAISKVYLSQTMTTDDGSSKSQSETHKEVRDDVIQFAADMLNASARDSFVNWLTAWNYPGAKVPIIKRVPEENEDLNKRAERDIKLYQMGFDLTEEYVQQTYGDGFLKRVTSVPASAGVTGVAAVGVGLPAASRQSGANNDNAPSGSSPAPADGSVPAAFGEAEEQTDEEVMTDHLDEATSQVLDGMIDQVRDLVSQATSPEELRDQLINLYPDLDISRQAAIIQRALVAAELKGQVDVLEGN